MQSESYELSVASDVQTLQQRYNKLNEEHMNLLHKYKKLKHYVRENQNSILGGGNIQSTALQLKSNYVKTLCTPYISNFITFLQDRN